MDLFTVPTASLRLLCGFFVIEHGRRHILHVNATFHYRTGSVRYSFAGQVTFASYLVRMTARE